MKYTLLLMRHAKSDYKDSSLEDAKRPLNKRGFKDAPMMGERIAQLNYAWDSIITSPALRAMMSAQSVADAVGYSKNMQIDNRLYLQGVRPIEEVLKELSDDVKSVMIVGHNPDFHELYEKLSKETLKKFPTGAYAIFEFTKPFAQMSEAKLLWFDRPKAK